MSKKTRLFTATFGTETNTFQTFPTGLGDFESFLMVRNGIESVPDTVHTAPARQWLKHGRAAGWEVVESLHCFAEPAGVTTRAAYEALRDEILADLRKAMPIDAAIFFLHGAMVAEGYDDCEGDFLARVRKIVGPKVVVGVELDLHVHLTDAMVDNADVAVIYKAYPHTDYRERADEVFALVRDTLAGKVKPVMAWSPCPVLGLFPTTRKGPMPQFVADMVAQEGKDGILSVSLGHGFPWADLPITGGAALVVADGDKAKARAVADRFARRFMAIKEDAALPFVPMDEALDRAARATKFPVLLADTSDQPGGGAPGDSTYLIEAMIARGLRDACFAPLWDPIATFYCFQAGVGARFNLRIGGKASVFSGRPLDLDVTVKYLERDGYQDWINGERIHVGDLAVVDAGGIEIMLTKERASVWHPSMFTLHQMDFRKKKIVCVKSLYRYYDFFAPLCSEMILVGTPGACNPEWSKLPYKRLKHPIWPLDEVPAR
ncbi:MAG: M81 family metallopeptidase [Alphaproteobacteria bacterium]|nr:M81 family metallopeptidase [Alphaproteobacteria bacterium]